MGLLHPLCFFFCLVVSLSAKNQQNCTRNQTSTVHKCNPIARELESYWQKYSYTVTNLKFYQKVEETCDRAINCYKSTQCDENQEYIKQVSEKCHYMIHGFNERKECLVKFMKDVRLAKNMDPDSCLANYEFLEKNSARKRSAYNEGKYCFLHYVDEICSEIALHYFSTRYENFVNTISATPDVYNCQDEHHVLNSYLCVAQAEETNAEIENMTALRVFFHLTNVKKTYKLCKNTQICFAEHKCVFNTHEMMIFGKKCDDLEKRF